MGKEDKMQNGKAVAKEERLKALDAALSQIEKQYGKGSINKLYYVDTPFWNVDTIYYTEIDITKAIPNSV